MEDVGGKATPVYTIIHVYNYTINTGIPVCNYTSHSAKRGHNK